MPKPLPLPGQLKPLPSGSASVRNRRSDRARRPSQRGGPHSADPQRLPQCRAGLPVRDGALYQVYTAPGQVTDIALQDGEQLVGSGPVAAGDTVRWIIGDTESGTAANETVHILVKPTRPDLVTNLVINTDRRTYHLELRSTEKTYMASVSWLYPQDQLIALRRQNAVADAAAPVETDLDISSLRFRYAIEGDNPPWRPLRAFDDGTKVYIEFPRGIRQGEMPPLFVVGPEGGAELVNYRARQITCRRSPVRCCRTSARGQSSAEGSHRPHRRETAMVSGDPPKTQRELAAELRLHPQRPPVTRLSRKVLIGLVQRCHHGSAWRGLVGVRWAPEQARNGIGAL